MNNFFIQDKNFNKYFLLNILFLVTPVIFLFSMAVSTVFSLVFCIIFFVVFKKEKIALNFLIADKILLLFFILVISITIYEIFKQTEDIKSKIVDSLKTVSIIRFFFVYFLIRNALEKNLIIVKYFLLLSLIFSIFISINILLMHILGEDIFGNKELNERFSTIFGNRAIAGSYILSFAFFGLIFISYLKKFHNFYIFFYLLVTGLGILFSLDRSPFILFFLIIVTITILSFKKNYFFSFLSILLLIIFFVFINFNEKLKHRYLSLNLNLKDFKTEFIFTLEEKKEDFEKTGFDYYSYGKIYKESLQSIMYERTFLGSGIKSFPERCKNLRLKFDKNSLIHGYFLACPSHSHNLFLEIAISSGLIGFSLFLIFLLINISNIINQIKVKDIFDNSIYLNIIFITFLIEIFPFRPMGNIFSTYNGFLFFFKISVLIFLLKDKKFFKKYHYNNY